MNRINLVLAIIVSILSLGCNNTAELKESYKENERLKSELDSLKKLMSKENYLPIIFQRNYSQTIREKDTLLITTMVINKHVGVDSGSYKLNLFKYAQNGDPILLDEKKYILNQNYLNGCLFFSLGNMTKGNYFIESKFNVLDHRDSIRYEWEIQ